MNNDAKTTLLEVKKMVANMIDERDWNQFHFPKNLSMKIAIEAAELMEKFSWVDQGASDEELKHNRQEIEDEFADVIITALAFANRAHIDVASAVQSKLTEIEAKYPIEKAKGKTLKYNKLG